jgi:hypothetical protein
MTIFYCLRFETHPTRRARFPYLYPPGAEWPSYIPRHWVPFSSFPTTHRATVEVFGRVSTRVSLSGSVPDSRSELVYEHCLSWCRGCLPCKRGGRWVILHASDAMRQSSTDAPRQLSQCRPAAGGEVWCVLLTPRSCKPCIRRDSRLRFSSL